MVVENGNWIMQGVEPNDPKCIHTVEEATTYIEKVGFLPLFKNEITGFSLEEFTVPEYWWSDDPEKDPWKWREVIAKRGEIAYGKFFGKKAGFISKKWLPVFANYRRDGYDFDALYEDGKAPYKQKLIMDISWRTSRKLRFYPMSLSKWLALEKVERRALMVSLQHL